jgi:hypothetical protein
VDGKKREVEANYEIWQEKQRLELNLWGNTEMCHMAHGYMLVRTYLNKKWNCHCR